MGSKRKTAWFVRLPRRISELKKPHLIENEQPYEIVKVIELSAIDYENFSEDLLVDRQIIEDNYNLCSDGDIKRCLLVKQHGVDDGILVVPEMGSYVKLAAYISQTTE